MSHRSRLAGFIIDCNTDDLDAAADFWSQALGCSIADRDAGDDTAQYQMFGDTPGDLLIEVQKVTHPSRVHLDIEADDVDAEAERLEKLGAKKIAFVKRWWVMEAPSGQRFCVVRM
jgi:predicted enzyme related to lactoylglutathione lyase